MKNEEKGKPLWEQNPPQNVNVDYGQLLGSGCPSPQGGLIECEFFLSEGLCEYVCNLFKRGIVLDIDDPIMN
jgi:hypothetical protein